MILDEMAIKKVKAFKTLRDIEKMCRVTRFNNTSVCGSCVAKNIKGRLVYVPNESEADKQRSKTVDEIRYNLHKYCLISKNLFDPEYQLTAVEMAKLKKSISRVKDYCLKYGFYGKALDCAKILKRNFYTDELETVEQAVKGYAKRQILTGDDQRGKITGIMRDVYMFNKYGRNAKSKKKTYYWDIFNSEQVVVRGTAFGVKDYAAAIKVM